MRTRSTSSKEATWLSQIQDYYSIHNILRLHDLTYWIIHWDGKKGLKWREINEEAGRLQPFHFEIHYGRQAKRDAYYLRCLRQAARSQHLVVASLFGFSDLFYQIGSGPHGHSFLMAGQFCLEPLDWAGLAKRWRELTGTAAAR